MAKKARFYKVFFKTAYKDNDIYWKPVPAPSKDVAKSMIANDSCNVTTVQFIGWIDIWIAPGYVAESNDLAIFGININENEFTYTSGDVGWNYLNDQFHSKVNTFINENYEDY
ncbi:hypothetical protein [[Curtobacterium] plantarum]|uniref:Uncharacterized protein n=1 Tax=[Curtobacterium] plantarum TaxID=221276 RepID=A0ABT9TCH9_9GAMM|nr:hypothetical protein [[Curtobacterium] plantarum]MDQ0020088.1 hypothetical protein [[Curtobacterium] plantarum]